MVRERAPFHQKNTTTVEVNRNILEKLLRSSIEPENKIDIKEALKYPLSPVTLSLCHANGTKRSCKKAGIYNVIDYRATTPESVYNNIKTYIFDLMAVIRCVGIFKTIKELIFKILNTIRKGYHRVDVVADSYRTVSWKNKTRDARGKANRTVIKSVETKILGSLESLTTTITKRNLLTKYLTGLKLTEQKC